MPKLPWWHPGDLWNFLWKLLEQGRRLLDERERFLETLPAEEELAVIAFTSGTTSSAKPVMLSAKGILHNASDSVGDGSPRGKAVYRPALLPYLRPDLFCFRPFGGGNSSVRQWQPKNYDAGFAAFRPTVMMTVPLMVEMVHRRLVSDGLYQGMKEEH